MLPKRNGGQNIFSNGLSNLFNFFGFVSINLFQCLVSLTYQEQSYNFLFDMVIIFYPHNDCHKVF